MAIPKNPEDLTKIMRSIDDSVLNTIAEKLFDPLLLRPTSTSVTVTFPIKPQVGMPVNYTCVIDKEYAVGKSEIPDKLAVSMIETIEKSIKSLLAAPLFPSDNSPELPRLPKTRKTINYGGMSAAEAGEIGNAIHREMLRRGIIKLED